jgi:hypothetical protein
MAARKTTESPPASQTPGEGLAARLIEHAKTIRNPAAAAAMGNDMRAAALILQKWQEGIREAIASTADDTTRARLSKLLEGDADA